MIRLLLLLLLAILLTACPNDKPQVEPEIAPVTENRYEFRDRIIWQKPGVVLDALGDLEEKVVADIGAGEGFFAQRLAPLVDRVIAIEIDPHWIGYLNDTLKQHLLPQNLHARLEARLATPDDPRLEDKEVDVVLIVNTFLEIDNQIAYLRKLYPALKTGGRIVIVDWKKRRMPIGPDQSKRVPLYRLEEMLQEAGYHLLQSDDVTLEYQYIVVADKKE